jgi:hypothetical protein
MESRIKSIKRPCGVVTDSIVLDNGREIDTVLMITGGGPRILATSRTGTEGLLHSIPDSTTRVAESMFQPAPLAQVEQPR